MPRVRYIDPFYMIVTDKDHGTFSVEGPMTDDRPWNHAVVLAQNQGDESGAPRQAGRLPKMPLESGSNDIPGSRCCPVRSSTCKETAPNAFSALAE